MVAVEINKYLVADNFCDASGIRFFLTGNKTYITLPEIRKFIVNYEDQSFLKGVIKKFLGPGNFFRKKVRRIIRQGFSLLVKVGVELVVAVKVPVKIIVLHPVFSEGHLGTIMELAR